MNKTFIIAEAGKNFITHDWKAGHNVVETYLTNACELANQAKVAGADAIKFQTHVFEDEKDFRGEYRHEWIKFNEEATPIEFWEKLKAYCDEIGIEFMTTPMSKKAAEKVNHLVKRWKIGSGNTTDVALLEFLAFTKKPVILSTGMSTQVEIGVVLHVLKDNDVSLLYCKSLYPCPLEALDFKTIDKMKHLSGKTIGFSDHTLELTTPMNAVIYGAEIVEKHFTLDKEAVGPDHKISLTPSELKWAVKLVRDYERYRGDGEQVAIVPNEEEVRLRMKFNS